MSTESEAPTTPDGAGQTRYLTTVHPSKTIEEEQMEIKEGSHRCDMDVM